MASEADDAQARKEAYRARRQERSRRAVAKIFIGLAVLWVVLATVRWFDDDSDAVSWWVNAALAVGGVGLAWAQWWRHLRRRPAAPGDDESPRSS